MYLSSSIRFLRIIETCIIIPGLIEKYFCRGWRCQKNPCLDTPFVLWKEILEYNINIYIGKDFIKPSFAFSLPPSCVKSIPSFLYVVFVSSFLSLCPVLLFPLLSCPFYAFPVCRVLLFLFLYCQFLSFSLCSFSISFSPSPFFFPDSPFPAIERNRFKNKK